MHGETKSANASAAGATEIKLSSLYTVTKLSLLYYYFYLIFSSMKEPVQLLPHDQVHMLGDDDYVIDGLE